MTPDRPGTKRGSSSELDDAVSRLESLSRQLEARNLRFEPRIDALREQQEALERQRALIREADLSTSSRRSGASSGASPRSNRSCEVSHETWASRGR